LQIEAKNSEAHGAAAKLFNKNMQVETVKMRFAVLENTPQFYANTTHRLPTRYARLIKE